MSARVWAAGLGVAGGLVLLGCRPTAPGPAKSEATSGDSTRDAVVRRIDSVAQAFRTDNHVPGMSIGVVRGADTLVLTGFGLANVEDSVPATPATVYRIGSITKQFTAAAILRLVEQGRIGLDVPLSTYLPGFPAPGRRLTVRQLLTHTSGLPNYTDLPDFPTKMRSDLTDDELLALVDRRPLDFPAGSQWRYSNSGFYLLGVLLQHLTGESYAATIDRTIAKPLGLTDTRYCGVEPIIPHRASGYSVDDDTLVNASFLSMRLPGAAGALCSTAGDLLRWQRDLAEGRVVTPATYQAMTTPAVLADGKRTAYGFALGTYALHGHAAVEHSGGINGFSSDLAYYPADSLSVVVLMNTDAAGASELARQIAESVIGIPDSGSLDLTVTDRQRYVGTYAAATAKPRIEERGERLVLVQRLAHPLRFQGGDRFVTADDHDVTVRFHVVDGHSRSLTITEPDGTAHEFARAP
jgi:D-alanyl-D-alanine carboxypeptidase